MSCFCYSGNESHKCIGDCLFSNQIQEKSIRNNVMFLLLGQRKSQMRLRLSHLRSNTKESFCKL